MTNHIDPKSLKSYKIKVRSLSVGCLLILALGGWLGGELIAKTQASHTKPVHHTRYMHRAPAYHHHEKKHTNFKPHVASNSIQGSYVTYLPVKDNALSRYYQLASLVHIKGDKICQQFLLVPKRATQMPSAKKHKRHFTKKEYRNLIPVNVRRYADSVGGYIANLNAEATIGNVSKVQTGNGYSVHAQLKMYTNLTAYNGTNLRMDFGTSRPYLVVPTENAPLNFNINSKGNLFSSGYKYRKIPVHRAKKLLSEGQGKLFFNNY